MAEPAAIRATGRSYESVFAIGDVHGDPEALRSVLRDARLIDSRDTWCGGGAHLIQCGDVVDRGPDSAGCLAWLQRLRTEARRAGGRVDLLIGNHELALARGDASLSDVPQPAVLGEVLVRAIRRGQMVAARAYRQYLVTHAGVHPELLAGLVEHLGQDGRRVTVAALARFMNLELKRAIAQQAFEHPMFRVGAARGGDNPWGGIFWADYDEFPATAPAPGVMWQVFGHTPPVTATAGGFRIDRDGQRVNIDVGMCVSYGGIPGYAELGDGQLRCISCAGGTVCEEPTRVALLA